MSILAARSCIHRSSTCHCRWHFATSIDIISLAINCKTNTLPTLVTVYTVKYKLGCRWETARSFLSLSQVLRLKLSSKVCQKLMRMCQLSRILWAFLSAWNCLARCICDWKWHLVTDGRTDEVQCDIMPMEGLYSSNSRSYSSKMIMTWVTIVQERSALTANETRLIRVCQWLPHVTFYCRFREKNSF